MRLLRWGCALAAITGLGYAQPSVSAVLNAASASGEIAPGSLASIYGSGFAASTEQAESFPLPTTLGGVTVTLNGTACPLLFVNSTQINFQVPFETQPGAATLKVTTNSASSSSVTIAIFAAAPGIFPGAAAGSAAAENQDSSVNSDSNPAAAGSVITVFLTGQGPVSVSGGLTGEQTPSPLIYATRTASATIGGLNAPIQFLGLAPGQTTGLAQANLQVPNLAAGDYPVIITIDGAASLSATVSIKGPGTENPPLGLLGSVSTPIAGLQALTLPGFNTVAVNGQYAYVCNPNLITIVDLAAGSAIASFGQGDLNGAGVSCFLDQGALVEIVQYKSLVVYSLSNPAHPVRVGSTNLQYPSVYPYPSVFGQNVLLTTNHFSYSLSSKQFISQGGEAEVYNFSNAATPTLLSTLTPTTSFPGNDNNSPRFGSFVFNNQFAAILGTTANGSNPNSGTAQFTMLDVSNPLNLNYINQITVPPAVVLTGIAAQGTSGLLVGNTNGWKNPGFTDAATGIDVFPFTGNLTFTLVDFTNPLTPFVQNTVVTTIPSYTLGSVAALGGGFYAILYGPAQNDIHGPSTLAVLDARNPQAPALYTVAALAGPNDGMTISGNNLYVAHGLGLSVYQINVP